MYILFGGKKLKNENPEKLPDKERNYFLLQSNHDRLEKFEIKLNGI